MTTQGGSSYADDKSPRESKIESTSVEDIFKAPEELEKTEAAAEKVGEKTEVKKEAVKGTSELKRNVEFQNLKDVKTIESINISKLPENKEEKEVFAYFKNILSTTFVVLFAKGLKLENVSNFSDVGFLKIDSFGLKPMEKSALIKLQEIAKNTGLPLHNEFSKNWQSFAAESWNLSRNVNNAADNIKQEVSGKKPKEEKNNKTWEWIKAHPKTSALFLAAGAIGAYVIWRKFSQKSSASEKTGVIGKINNLWKWGKIGLGTALGVFAVGRLLEWEVVQTYLHKKLGWDLSDNRFTKFLIYLSHGEFVKAFEALGGETPNTDVLRKAKEVVKAETGVEPRVETLRAVSGVKYGEFMSVTSGVFDKVVAGITDTLGLPGSNKNEIIAIRKYLEKHDAELKQKGMTDDMSVGQAFELLGLGAYEKSVEKEKKEEPEDKSWENAIGKNAPVLFARPYQWGMAYKRYKESPLATQLLVKRSFEKGAENIGLFKTQDYADALGKKGVWEAELKALEEKAPLLATDAEKITNEALQGGLKANLTALESQKAWKAFQKEAIRTPEHVLNALSKFEEKRAKIHTGNIEYKRLELETVRDFDRLADELNNIVDRKNVVISNEMKEIVETEKLLKEGKLDKAAVEIKIKEKLTRIAETETKTIEEVDKFMGENADFMRKIFKDKGGFEEGKTGAAKRFFNKIFGKEGSQISDVARFEDMRAPLSQRMKQPLRFGLNKTGAFVLCGIGATGIISEFSKNGSFWPAAGKAALGFVPIAAEYIDLKDGIKAFAAGDVKEGVLNMFFLVGDTASDLLLFSGVGSLFGAGGKSLMASIKGIRGASSVIKVAKEADAIGKFTKVVSKEEKVAYKIYEESSKVEKVALEASELGKLEQTKKIFGKVSKMIEPRKAFLQKAMKVGFVGGTVLALSSVATPIAEWAFGGSKETSDVNVAAIEQIQRPADADIELNNKS